MKKNTKKEKGISTGGKIAIGAGVAAVSAGAYYLMGPNAKANQKKVSGIMNKMKKEVVSEIKKAKKLGAPLYNKAVDTVSKNYAKQYKLHEKDLKDFTKKLKSEWKDVSAKVSKVASKSKKK